MAFNDGIVPTIVPPEHPFPGEAQYLNTMADLLAYGVRKGERTGFGMREIFGAPQMVFDLNDGHFPLLTTKKMFLKGIIVELLWFLRGDTNIKFLRDHNVHIWDKWADENGDLGPVYGAMWRRWPVRPGAGLDVDQIAVLLDEIRSNPNSRRMTVSAWNAEFIKKMALPPCHCLFQCNVQPMSPERRERWARVHGFQIPLVNPSMEDMDRGGVPSSELHLKLYQRSADWFIGVPFNIASYALLTMMIAKVCGLAPGRFIHTFGSAHLYENHIEQAQVQLERQAFAPPRMKLDSNTTDIDGFKLEDFKLEGYGHHPTIKADVNA